MVGTPLKTDRQTQSAAAQNPSAQNPSAQSPSTQSPSTQSPSTQSLAEQAKALGIKFFLVSYTDLLGGTRAKLETAAKIASVEKDGAFFSSFASNLGLGPDAAEIAAIPDVSSLIQLPWEPTVGWVASKVYFEGEPFPAAPRMILSRVADECEQMAIPTKLGWRPSSFC